MAGASSCEGRRTRAVRAMNGGGGSGCGQGPPRCLCNAYKSGQGCNDEALQRGEVDYNRISSLQRGKNTGEGAEVEKKRLQPCTGRQVEYRCGGQPRWFETTLTTTKHCRGDGDGTILFSSPNKRVDRAMQGNRAAETIEKSTTTFIMPLFWCPSSMMQCK